MRKELSQQIQKLIIHSFSSEVIEYIYCQSDDKQRMEMVIGLYGNYFLLLKDYLNETKTQVTLKSFIAQKPNLEQGIMEKLESMVNKLVEKGLTRHSIV